MTRATTLIIAIVTFLDGVASLTATPDSVTGIPREKPEITKTDLRTLEDVLEHRQISVELF